MFGMSRVGPEFLGAQCKSSKCALFLIRKHMFKKIIFNEGWNPVEAGGLGPHAQFRYPLPFFSFSYYQRVVS